MNERRWIGCVIEPVFQVWRTLPRAGAPVNRCLLSGPRVTSDLPEDLARQMHFTALALLLRNEAAVARILRENNRFN